MGGALAGAMTATQGKFPPRDRPTEPDADARARPHGPRRELPGAGRQAHLRQALVASSSPATGRATTQPNHIRVRADVPREVAELWAQMCPAQVYEVGEADGDGTVEVEVTPSNCVQCGAITAKGGRLTPPEGGSGPEYTLT